MKSRRKLNGIASVGGAWASVLWLVSTAGTASAQSSVEKLQEFGLDEVQITDEYQKNLFDKDITYLITTLDSDRLLEGFRAVSLGTSPTNLYGGWESTTIRGHTMGHWLSAVAYAYQQTQDSDPTLASEIKIKLDDAVSKLRQYQRSDGFLFASPVSEFDAFDNGTGGWVPYYTMHKILAGLIDAHRHGGNEDALAVASNLGDWIHARASGWSASAKSRVLSQEYGGMNDALYDLYKLTNSADHLTVAHVFDDTGLFTTTAEGTDTLNGKHANMTIPKFIGALNRYRTLGVGEQSYLAAADQFLAIVQENHSYVTGGNSQDEHFHEPGRLDARRDNVNNETCNAYNVSKLTRDLFRVTGDVKYADFYERIHINEILSSINPETGMTTYFKAMGTGYFKVFGSPTDHFWCCTGTGMENFTKLGDSVYFHDDKDLWVTYYVSSTLNWKERGLSLTQTTDLPFTDRVSFTITAAPTDEVNLLFRKPSWTSTCDMAVAVNGQTVTPVEVGGFLGVKRVWQASDTVEVAFPLFVQASRLRDNQNSVAFTYGPLVLSAGLGTASMTTASHGVQVLKATKPNGLQDTIAINGDTTVNDWLANLQNNLVQTAGKLEFTLRNTDSDNSLVFVPHYSRYQDRYGIYWLLSGTPGETADTRLVCPTVTAGGADVPNGTGGTSGNGGASGNGGVSGNAGVSGNGGATSAGGFGGGGPGGSTGVGAVAGYGGTNLGGLTSVGGSPSETEGAGGRATASGASGGGLASVGGSAPGTGGSDRGATATGATGAAPIGGAPGAGGAPAVGATGTAAGGLGAIGAVGGATSASGGGDIDNGGAQAKGAEGGDDSGCSCRVGARRGGSQTASLLLGVGLFLWARRRHAESTRRSAVGVAAGGKVPRNRSASRARTATPSSE